MGDSNGIRLSKAVAPIASDQGTSPRTEEARMDTEEDRSECRRVQATCQPNSSRAIEMNQQFAAVRYDAMVYAIAECHKIDEVKELHDKALALELYAKQAMNVDAERKASEVRLRAERRAGELMGAMQKAKGGDPSVAAATVAGASQYKEALTSAGINERTARRWQELAAVPKKTFEDALRDPEKKPTTTGILKAVNGTAKMDNDSLWIWGRIRDFEREKIIERDPKELFDGMTQTMQDDVLRILPNMIEWIKELINE